MEANHAHFYHRQLCRALLAEGHELTALSRNPASVPVKCGAAVHALDSLLLVGQRVLPMKMGVAQYRFAFTDLADALRDLWGK